MSGCPYPGCEWKGQSRPYANRRDGIPSASTVAGMADEKSVGMAWAAAGITAWYALHDESWFDLDPVIDDTCTGEKDGFCKACRHVRGEFDRRWKAKAALGNHCHHLVCTLAEGGEVEAGPEVEGYLNAFDAFVVEHSPEFLHLERTIVSGGDLKYRGTFDVIADLTVAGERVRYLIDWKTGRFHPWPQTLQLSAYRYSDYLTSWVDGVEQNDGPMPRVKGCAVVLLHEDGTFKLQDLPVSPKTYSAFMKLRAVWDVRREVEEWARDSTD